jgi:RNA polymerase sigma-54 factor
MNQMDMRAEHKQAQTLSPRLQHAVRLLQMSSLDFAAMVRDSMGKNPFLESDEAPDSDGQEAGPQAAGATRSEEWSEAAAPLPLGFNGLDEPGNGEAEAEADSSATFMDSADVEGFDSGVADADASEASDRDLWSADGAPAARDGSNGGGESGLSAVDMMKVETSLTAHLHGQLNVMPLPARDLLLARVVVESLDDDGYLRTPLNELLALGDLDELQPPASDMDMQIALKRVQSLEPAGVAARSVCECLQLQLHSIECPATQALAKAIVCDHIALLAARDMGGLSRVLGQTPARTEAVCDRIRRLDPRPGWRFGSSHIAYVVPDVVVRKLRGQWTVQLNPAVVPKVRLNQVYEQLFQRHRSAQHTEMGAQLHEARWTMRNVEQRFVTILDVANAIVRQQKNFLECGPMAMKPLGLKQIADEVGVHESTVSRVTNNKYMATPVGMFELKYFFSRAMPTASGGSCSGIALRGLIKDMIEAEHTDAPLSDAEITRQFAQQGLVVARRTVTKYRQMLKIESVERRRRHALS